MSTLSVTISETITINGKDRGSDISLDVDNITQVMHRIVSLPADGGSAATQTTVANFRTAVTTADSAMDDDDVRYIRITNLDSSNDVHLSLQLAANGTADASTTSSILLKPGYSLMLCSTDNAIAVDDDAATPITSGSLVHLESILAINETNDTTQLEVFIAS